MDETALSHEESSGAGSRRVGLSDVTECDREYEQWLEHMAEGLTAPASQWREEAMRELSTTGRANLGDELSAVAGLPRRCAAVLAGVDFLDTGAERLSRYVRATADDIRTLALRIEEVLAEEGIERGEELVLDNLSDLRVPLEWFAQRSGLGRRGLRAMAEEDLLSVRVVSEDIEQSRGGILDSSQ